MVCCFVAVVVALLQASVIDTPFVMAFISFRKNLCVFSGCFQDDRGLEEKRPRVYYCFVFPCMAFSDSALVLRNGVFLIQSPRPHWGPGQDTGMHFSGRKRIGFRPSIDNLHSA